MQHMHDRKQRIESRESAGVAPPAYFFLDRTSTSYNRRPRPCAVCLGPCDSIAILNQRLRFNHTVRNLSTPHMTYDTLRVRVRISRFGDRKSRIETHRVWGPRLGLGRREARVQVCGAAGSVPPCMALHPIMDSMIRSIGQVTTGDARAPT